MRFADAAHLVVCDFDDCYMYFIFLAIVFIPAAQCLVRTQLISFKVLCYFYFRLAIIFSTGTVLVSSLVFSTISLCAPAKLWLWYESS